MKTLQQTCQIINTKTIKLFGALFIMLFVQSCMKEEYDKVEHKTNYYYLTAAQLNQTPYFTNPTFDTISFTSNKGDTLTFVKSKTDTTWYCEKGWGNPNTGYDKDCYQTIHNTYATVKVNGSFDVEHVLRNGPYRKILNINMNNNAFEPYDYQIGLIGYPTYKSEITILNKTFYSLIAIFSNPGDTSSNKAYINKKYGLFYFEDLKSNTQYLILK
jgi:hypothetical protein